MKSVEGPGAAVARVSVGALHDAIELHCLSLKVIRKFFFKHNKSFRWHLGDYEKHNFFSI